MKIWRASERDLIAVFKIELKMRLNLHATSAMVFIAWLGV
ncbi:hypothetical protein CAMRE0001_2041 [Campylobacter rectus RM3267]|uniref:Uncharacterized protein n=1 Tax=Campylobacter rectus RM3267 TaxID=553218 RepID=B9D4I5_CAMRE|nr:hypothetical protein CAMRE0001_2041 [Campylobacter rectus RM3267]